MRLFVAVDVPATLKDAVESEVVSPLRTRLAGARVTWVQPEGRHITLKFLGNVHDERVDEIAGAVGKSAGRHPAFVASFAEFGGFPNLRRPRVLWLGLGDGAQRLTALTGDLEQELAGLGFAREGHPFHPHLTLVRFRHPSVREMQFECDLPGDPFVVEEIVLFQSQLHPKGARYTPLERFPLGR